jgi:hypothetical protein
VTTLANVKPTTIRLLAWITELANKARAFNSKSTNQRTVERRRSLTRRSWHIIT